MSDMILVTGVTGNVGKEVINQLIEKGQPVKAAARNLPKAASAGLRETEIVLFDYNRPETFKPALLAKKGKILSSSESREAPGRIGNFTCFPQGQKVQAILRPELGFLTSLDDKAAAFRDTAAEDSGRKLPGFNEALLYGGFLPIAFTTGQDVFAKYQEIQNPTCEQSQAHRCDTEKAVRRLMTLPQ